MNGHEKRFVDEAFETNWIAPMGPNVAAFGKELCEHIGAKSDAVLASGTAAIHLALKLTGIRPGDRVFCSSLTFSASANPILYEQGEPVFIDSEEETWGMSPEALERARADLYAFTREVADVRAIESLRVDIGGVATALDVVADNPFVDLYVQKKIDDAQDGVEAAIKATRTVLARLEALR